MKEETKKNIKLIRELLEYQNLEIEQYKRKIRLLQDGIALNEKALFEEELKLKKILLAEKHNG